MAITITPKSGNRPPSIKIPAPQSPAGIRGKPSPMKGLQNPAHYHVTIKSGCLVIVALGWLAWALARAIA